jgi:hypothetical protein
MLPAPERQLGAGGDQSHALHAKEKSTCHWQVDRMETT